MKSILVLCIGNICRSPMAQVLLAAALPGKTVSSAGVGALVGYPADPMAQELMRERGLDLGTHHARQVNAVLCKEADLILTMDNGQRHELESRYPWTQGRVFRLCEATRSDVPDPYRQNRGAFEDALRLIDQGVQAWAGRIRQL